MTAEVSNDENRDATNCSFPFRSMSKGKAVTFVIILTTVLGITLLPSDFSDVTRFSDEKDRDCKDDPSLYEKRFPNAMIIGVRKGGTRALLDFLSFHRDIQISPLEVHYFDWNYAEGFYWYLQQMPKSCPGQITLEKSPNYFFDSETPGLLYKYNPFIKIILVLRNPVERALSDYVQLKEHNKKELELANPFEKLAFNQTTGKVNASYRPVRNSLYYIHLKRWLKYFNVAQFLILDGDNLINRPWEELSKAEDFLDLEHQLDKSRFIITPRKKNFFCLKLTEPNDNGELEYCLGNSKGETHPMITDRKRRELMKYYKPYNEILFKMINRRFNWS